MDIEHFAGAEHGDFVFIDSHTMKILLGNDAMLMWDGRRTTYPTGDYPAIVLGSGVTKAGEPRLILCPIGESYHSSSADGPDPIQLVEGIVDLSVDRVTRKKYAWPQLAFAVKPSEVRPFPNKTRRYNLSRLQGCETEAIVGLHELLWKGRDSKMKGYDEVIRVCDEAMGR